MQRIALFGAGGMAGVHADCYAHIPNAQVVGIFDIRADVAESLATKHGATAYTTFESMLKEARADVLDICCPTPWHAEYVCEAAARAQAIGLRGISTEKPMASTVADCEKMTAACTAAGVPLFVAHVVRFFPEFALARGQVNAGAVGAPAAIRTRRGGAMPRGWNDWFADYRLSGGVILDLLVHDFDWMRWTFGEVERVYAKGLAASHLPALDYALVTLRFVSGAIGHVEGTWADPGGFKVAIEIAGDAGLLDFNTCQPAGSAFTAALRVSGDAQTAVPMSDGADLLQPYRAELQHLVDGVEQGTPLSVTGADGTAAVRIACAAIESIQTGQVVQLNE